MTYDVVVIGAGVTGAFAARALSRYRLKVGLLEKEEDVAMGTSKANSAIIHAGYDAVPGSLKSRFNIAGSEMMEGICRELEVPFRRTGSLVLAFKGDDTGKLQQLCERGVRNGVKGLKILNREEILAREPAVSAEVEAGLFAPSGGIVCPYELTLAAVENAVENGVELLRGCEVTGIRRDGERFALRIYRKYGDRGFFRDSVGCGGTVIGSAEEIRCRFIINAAGLYSDKIAGMIGDDSFTIHPRRGEYIIYDKNLGETVDSVIFQLPGEKGKGILITPTVDGNLLIGPNAEDMDDRDDTSTTLQGLEMVLEGARKSVPSLSLKEEITAFAGLRARPSTGDFVIGPSAFNRCLLHAAGIESPGLTAAPAIAEYLVELLAEQGLEMEPKDGYNPHRKAIPRIRDMKDAELEEWILKNSAYGRIVCRCERVSEGEVVDCIRRPVGARSTDGVKRRVRSGMGRCQGGFCAPRIVEILSRELGIPMDEVTKAGGASTLLAGKVK